MDQSKWEEFTRKIENKLNEPEIEKDTPITEAKTLNKKWHNFNLVLKQATTKYIPFTYKQSRSEQRENINSHIEKRYSNFTDNTILMINSILKRYTDHIDLPNIKKENAVITDLAEIKTKVANHFKR
ncbi:23163_t:CDS:2 [Gigaspora margarita]|uniref:23163_t:CDS:1 n=1 Tax=Gigaspora margarita TaxID=4874 RepID=A0ABN7V366_GIGMA|nr:23163_t:CDS:2 [Gigaspora margarita]